jgi:hypothetical protein
LSNPSFPEETKRLSQAKKSFADLVEAYKDLIMFTLPGDFFDMNDAYPMLSKSTTRRRVYVSRNKEDYWQLVRFEFTKDILDMYNKVHI